MAASTDDHYDLPITALPNELICLILDFILDPLDVFNAAITCKQFWALSEQSMKEHSELSEEYGLLSFPSIFDPSLTVWTVLSNILRNPKAGYHVRDIRFGGNRPPFYDTTIYDESDLTVNSHRPPPQMLSTFAALEGADEILSANSTTLLDFRNGCTEPVISLLIRQLPNLFMLTYFDKFNDDTFSSFLSNTAIAFNSATPPSFLSQLKVVHLSHWDTEGGMNLSWIYYFLSLPSVQDLHGHMVQGEDWVRPPPADLGARQSNITTLDLSHSSIDSESLDQLLSGIRGLKSFSYSCGGATVGYSEYDPRGFIAVLLQHASHSLEVLNINGQNEEMDDSTPHCSLSGFQRLRHLETEWKALMMIEDDLVNLEEDIELPKGFYKQPDLREMEQHGIAAFLPATIETLKIYDFLGADLSLFLQLLEQKQKGKATPNLRRLIIHMTIQNLGKDWLKDLKDASATAGFSFEPGEVGLVAQWNLDSQ